MLAHVITEVSRYPEGWIDPEIASGIVCLLALFILFWAVVIMIIKQAWEEDKERYERNARRRGESDRRHE